MQFKLIFYDDFYMVARGRFELPFKLSTSNAISSVRTEEREG